MNLKKSRPPGRVLHIRIDDVGGFHGVAVLPSAFDGAAVFKLRTRTRLKALTLTRVYHLILDDGIGSPSIKILRRL